MIKFGTGGWRAIIGEEFTKENVTLLAQGIASYVKSQVEEEKDEVGFIVGYDRRFLSERAAMWICEVMAANEITVYLIQDIAPTPLIMYTVDSMKLKYGIAVTASHNSFDYNGIKLFAGGGRDATLEITEEIEKIVNGLTLNNMKEMEFEEGVLNGKIKRIDPFNDYIDNILQDIDVSKIKERRLKVLLDPMYGVAKTCLQTVLISARCSMDVINDRHDPLFGGKLPSPSDKTLNKLRDMVVDRKYDLGIATDGDADRLGIIDEKGNFIHPNDILVLLYYYLLEYKGMKGGVVRNIATTHLLDRIAIDYGEECYEVPVGFKHISQGMETHGAIIGGESSGGLTINGRIRGKDGIYSASLIVELLCVSNKRLSELLEEIHNKYGKMYMEERNYTFSQKKKEELYYLLFVEKKLPNYELPITKVSYEDGMKIYFENDGWIIARFSGTEPVLRIFAEMGSSVEVSKIADEMEQFLKLE
ncbi:MAG: phosphoglucomutase/phosphomannomutase family protein [Anaerocolumna sp.]